MQKLLPFVAFGGFVLIVFSPHEEAPARPSVAKELETVRRDETSARAADTGGFDEAMVLQRDRGGQFHVEAQVEGQDAEFLVDTGADIVALTVDEAERLGHPVDRADFVPLMQTASGTGNGAIVRLDRLEVAGAEFHDVDAVVLDGLPTNLLGQTVLSKLGQVSLEGDRMVIRR